MTPLPTIIRLITKLCPFDSSANEGGGARRRIGLGGRKEEGIFLGRLLGCFRRLGLGLRAGIGERDFWTGRGLLEVVVEGLLRSSVECSPVGR